MNRILVEEKIRQALLEDIGQGDITTEVLIDSNTKATGTFIAKEDGVIAGINVVKMVFAQIDDNVKVVFDIKEGAKVEKGEIIGEIYGSAQSILVGERLALNILQRMSGVATLTNYYAEQIKDLDTKIVDTRKTTPGFRIFEKMGVAAGGGYNHRYNLSDCMMIKDNHIQAGGGITKCVEKARNKLGHTTKIEVETENLDMVQEALDAGADIIMLDNMNLATMKEAVHLIDTRAITEASGNMEAKSIRDVALTGVNIISMGALTHSYKAMDISLRFQESEGN